MADYDWAKASEETAKAVQGGTELAKSFGSYAGEIARSSVETLFGIIDDRLRYVRGAQTITLYQKSLKRLKDAGLDTSHLQPPPPAIEIPLITAASNEDRDEIVDLWERLLAAAIAPKTRSRVRQSHIEIVKALEPCDALVLKNFEAIEDILNKRAQLANASSILHGVHSDFQRQFATVFRERYDYDEDEIKTSISALVKLGLLSEATIGSNVFRTPEARSFLRVVEAKLK